MERGVKCFPARQFEDEVLRRVMGIGEIPPLAPPHPTKATCSPRLMLHEKETLNFKSINNIGCSKIFLTYT